MRERFAGILCLGNVGRAVVVGRGLRLASERWRSELIDIDSP